MQRLKTDWPASLAAWDEREKSAHDVHGRYVPRDFCAHPILVIHLALELGLEMLLPAALYDLSRYGPSKIYIGAAPSPGAVYPSQSDSEGNSTPLVRLSDALLCKALTGRELAQAHLAAFIEHELTDRPASQHCINTPHSTAPTTKTNSCTESFYFIRLNILRAVGGVACGRDADPLYTLLQALEMLSRTDFTDGVQRCGVGLKICEACKVDFGGMVARARAEVWRLIPQWFGLGGGATLEGDA